MSRIVESRISADQSAPILLPYTATSCRTNLLPPSRRIFQSYISARRREAAATQLRDSIVELDVRNAPLPIDLHATSASCALKNDAWDQLEHYTATRWYFSDN